MQSCILIVTFAKLRDSSPSSGNATEIYFYGTQLATTLVGCIPVAVLVGKVILPVLYELRITSINEVRRVVTGDSKHHMNTTKQQTLDVRKIVIEFTKLFPPRTHGGT